MFTLQTPPVLPVTTQYWNAQQWGNAAQWVGAFLTFCAVVVALFKEDFLRWRHHPELTARLEARYPDCVKTPDSREGWKGSRYFLRLWVENIGDVRADKVEVFVRRAQAERKPGSFEDVPQFRPMNLRWSYSKHESPTIYTDGMSPHLGRYCDLAAIYGPDHPILGNNDSRPRLALITEILARPSEFLIPGKYRFEILIAASNREPVVRIVDVHLTGRWTENDVDMFTNGFTVSVRRG